MEDDAELWDVLLGPGRTERMTLDQLDTSYQSGVISAGTLIREPGSSEWRPLYEVAGLEPPELPSSVAPAPSAPTRSAPVRSAPVRSTPPPLPSAATPRSVAIQRSVATQRTAPQPSRSAPRSTPPTPESPSRPPALPVRRSKAPNRTSRGVPLPSVPPRDEHVNLSPKPLTPPTTSSRRVSAPPPGISSKTGSRVRRAPPSIVPAGEPLAPSARDTAFAQPRRPSERPTSAEPAAIEATAHVAPPLSAPPPPPPPITPALTVAVGSQPPGLPNQAPPLPEDAFAHLSQPPGGVSPSVFPLELPKAAEPLVYTPGEPLPPVTDPWTAPAPATFEPPVPAYAPSPAAPAPPQPLLVEEPRFRGASRPSALEIGFWALTLLIASSVVLHRNGTFQSWFGKYGYTLMEVQVLGKPSLNTVAGVKAFLAETTPRDSSTKEP